MRCILPPVTQHYHESEPCFLRRLLIALHDALDGLLKLSSLVSPPRVASLEDPPALARCRGLRSARPAERDGIKHADHAVVADRLRQSVLAALQLFITISSVARRSRRRKIFMMHECNQ